MHSIPKARIGVDIGGTFTDIALELGSEMYSTKILTDYTEPERAIIKGIMIALEEAFLQPGDVESIVHGTTLATNALIERRGAKVALITSEGFRDVIEMRTESRFEQYDLNITLPTPLVARKDRLTVTGRLSAQGDELIPIDLAELDDVIARIRDGGYDSIAIGLIHSYRNPAHEQLVAEKVRAALPDVSISLSSQVSPQIREYERFNTVCANAFVKPLMSSYLNRLDQKLTVQGFNCPVYMIHSGGGLMSLKSAAEFPVRLLESGPAGGAIYASHIASRFQLDKVLSYDMGGTTAKICLIDDQEPKTARTFEVARTYRFKKGSGMPISIPVIEMVEIGAGGGSIAHVDELRQIRVGPESAGSEPGPACYGRGGLRPTVTDADLVLGKLDPDRFAGGSFKLDGAASEASLKNDIASILGGSALQAAFGVSEVVDENMANAARVHAVESGCELEGYSMIAYGGAAPLHAVRLCEKLGIAQLIIPPGAGVGSAIGFLRAPFGYESLRSAVMRLSQFDATQVNTLLVDMREEVESFLRETGYQGALTHRLRAYMRYTGQGWEIPVDLDKETFTEADVPALRAAFTEAYQHFFGHTIDHLDIEVVSWSLQLQAPLAKVAPVTLQFGEASDEVAPLEVRPVFDAKSAVHHVHRIYERHALPVGTTINGPVIVIERETSTLITPEYNVTRQSDGCLLIQRRIK